MTTGRRLATVIVAMAAVSMTAAPTWKYDNDGPARDASMDALCASFVGWQKIMRDMGQPPETYAKTGMEVFCPGMV